MTNWNDMPLSFHFLSISWLAYLFGKLVTQSFVELKGITGHYVFISYVRQPAMESRGLHSAIGQLCALLITALCTWIAEPGVELSAVRELEKCVASHLINRGRGWFQLRTKCQLWDRSLCSNLGKSDSPGKKRKSRQTNERKENSKLANSLCCLLSPPPIDT